MVKTANLFEALREFREQSETLYDAATLPVLFTDVALRKRLDTAFLAGAKAGGLLVGAALDEGTEWKE